MIDGHGFTAETFVCVPNPVIGAAHWASICGEFRGRQLGPFGGLS